MRSRMLFLVCGLVVLGIAVTGCPPYPPPELSAAEIAVNGMTCDMCVEKIESAVGDLEGVHAVSVDLKEKLASVEFEAAKVKLADIEHAIADAGYSANATVRDEAAHEDLPSCCQ